MKVKMIDQQCGSAGTIFAVERHGMVNGELRITFVEVAAMVNRAAQQVVIGWSESFSAGSRCLNVPDESRKNKGEIDRNQQKSTE